MAWKWAGAGLAAEAVLLPMLFSGCASIDGSYQPRILSEDRSRAVMTMGFEYNAGDTFDDGSGADWAKAWSVATGRCQQWGYSVAVEEPDIRMNGRRNDYGYFGTAFASGMVERVYRCRKNASGAGLKALQTEVMKRLARRVNEKFVMDGCFWRTISGAELALYCYRKAPGANVQLIRAVKLDYSMPSSDETVEQLEFWHDCSARSLMLLSHYAYSSLDAESRSEQQAVQSRWRKVEQNGGMEDHLLNLVCASPLEAAQTAAEPERGQKLQDSENRRQSEALRQFPPDVMKSVLTDWWEPEEEPHLESSQEEESPAERKPVEKPQLIRRRSALPL